MLKSIFGDDAIFNFGIFHIYDRKLSVKGSIPQCVEIYIIDSSPND